MKFGRDMGLRLPCCHLPHGRCGLKSYLQVVRVTACSHLPHGRCGLKFDSINLDNDTKSHLPHGRCGLKFVCDDCGLEDAKGHLPHGRCGLKSYRDGDILLDNGSPSTRKVWIEITRMSAAGAREEGHLPHGRCGLKFGITAIIAVVAIVTFHTEGVD